MDSGSYEFLSVEVRNGVAIATMTHPDYDHSERREWLQLLTDVAGDEDLRVLIITGWGNPRRGSAPGAFEDFEPFPYYDRAAHSVRAFLDLDKPVIMALDGDPGV